MFGFMTDACTLRAIPNHRSLAGWENQLESTVQKELFNQRLVFVESKSSYLFNQQKCRSSKSGFQDTLSKEQSLFRV